MAWLGVAVAGSVFAGVVEGATVPGERTPPVADCGGLPRVVSPGPLPPPVQPDNAKAATNGINSQFLFTYSPELFQERRNS